MENHFTRPLHAGLGKGELAFLGHAFERFGRVLDPVLAVVSVGRKQTDHLIGTARGRTCSGRSDRSYICEFSTTEPPVTLT